MLIQPANRTLRLFVSSTFLDLHAEREELIKRIFPQVRKFCGQRNIVFSEVDLRWGITEEDATGGQILPICLEEINRCDVFLGILGWRYGYVIDDIPDELLPLYPWLADCSGLSLTELEMLHGALLPGRERKAAFFYFRMGGDTGSQPEEYRKKLWLLRERILASGQPVRGDCPSAGHLGQAVLDDLTRYIEKHFPPAAQSDPETVEQEAYANSRTAYYLPAPEMLAKLDGHVNADDGRTGLIVTGESGVGKSALIANWASAFRRRYHDRFLFLHFVGSSSQSGDWVDMIRRLLRQLINHFNLPLAIPDQPEGLRAALEEALHHAAERGQLVIVLDALNQLDDQETAQDLVWLPEHIPRTARCIFSTLPGRALDALRERRWPEVGVPPFNPDQRRRYIIEYLRRYSKTLSSRHVELITHAPATANALYLKSLLDELRVFGIHEQLDHRVRHYLTSAHIDDLFELILERYEQDYESGRPGLVGEVLTLIWASHKGLMETELLQMLSTGNAMFPRAAWSTFFLAAEGLFVNRAGRLAFAHAYIRQAVSDRYLSSAGTLKQVHQRLADHFDKVEEEGRRLEELPWHLVKIEEWERLKNFLADVGTVKAYKARGENHHLLTYWNALRPLFSPGKEYHRVLEQEPQRYEEPHELADAIRCVADFLYDFDIDVAETEALYARGLNLAERMYGRDSLETGSALNQLATSLMMQEREDEAEPLLQRALDIQQEHLPPDHPHIANTLSNLAIVYWGRDGDIHKAIDCYQRALSIYQQVWGSEHDKTILCIDNLSQAYIEAKDYASAERYARQSFELRKRYYGPNDYRSANGYNTLGDLLHLVGKSEEAVPLLRKALSIRMSLLGVAHSLTRTVYINLINALLQLRRLDELEGLLQMVLTELEKTPNRDKQLAVGFTQLGLEFYFLERYENAESAYKSALAILEQLGTVESEEAALLYNNYGMLLRAKGMFHDAERFLRQAVELWRGLLKLDDPLRARGLHNLALTLYESGDAGAAEPLAHKALDERERILGKDNVDTEATRQLLRKIRTKQKRDR